MQVFIGYKLHQYTTQVTHSCQIILKYRIVGIKKNFESGSFYFSKSLFLPVKDKDITAR